MTEQLVQGTVRVHRDSLLGNFQLGADVMEAILDGGEALIIFVSVGTDSPCGPGGLLGPAANRAGGALKAR